MEKWWLITWTTYGTWLPGDPRGFQTWRGRRYIPPPNRYAKPDETTYNPKPFTGEHQKSKQLSGSPVFLSLEQQKIALDAMVEDISEVAIIPAIISIEKCHVHLLAKFGELKIRSTVGRIKSAATRCLRGTGFSGKRVWGKNCHMKSKSTSNDFRNAIEYVRKHQEQGGLIYCWDFSRMDG